MFPNGVGVYSCSLNAELDVVTSVSSLYNLSNTRIFGALPFDPGTKMEPKVPDPYFDIRLAARALLNRT